MGKSSVSHDGTRRLLLLLLSAFGIILLAVLYKAESSYTHALGSHCKSTDEGPCTTLVEHNNQDDAATACMTALIFYCVTFVASFGCIFGSGSTEEHKLIM